MTVTPNHILPKFIPFASLHQFLSFKYITSMPLITCYSEDQANPPEVLETKK